MRRRILGLVLLASLAAPPSAGALPGDLLHYDYAGALRASLRFYEAQRSGAHHARYTWRVDWRQPAALSDGADVGVDLSGGWFDAGDHVKFGLPMAYSATMLGWSLVDFPTAYDRAGDAAYARDNLRFALDYFLQAYQPGGPGDADDRFYYQVGYGGLDHAFWGPPQAMTMARPAFACSAAAPCSEVMAGTAAALAAGSMVFAASDPVYAVRLLDTARQLYGLADRLRSSAGYTRANGYYTSFSGFWDELAWGAAWLHRATGEAAYLTQAEAALAQAQDATYWAHNWDNVSNGTRLLLARAGRGAQATRLEQHLEHWLSGLPRSPGGLVFLDRWGSLRYATTTAFLALDYAATLSDPLKRERYERLALSQVNYALGDNPRGASYVVGVGANAPRNPHHRGAHDSPTFNIDVPVDNRHELTGALVGGPASANDFDYVDDRHDYVRNEVATDYNAGYTGALAAIVALADGGYVPPTAPPTAVRSATATPSPTATLPPGGGLATRVVPQSDWGAGYCADVVVSNSSAVPIDWTVSVPYEGALTQSWNAVVVSSAGGVLTAGGVSWNNLVAAGGSVSFGFCADRNGAPAPTATRPPNTVAASPTATRVPPTAVPPTATATRPAATASTTPTRTTTRTPTRTSVPATATATSAATRTATRAPTTPAGGGVSVQLVPQSEWGSGYCSDVIVSNAGGAAVDWRVSFAISGRVTQLWNAVWSFSGGVVTAEGVAWNNLVYPGQLVVFGFCAER
ncbi:MAG: glycoside hydrolase family 9 protein [Deltaproteobacteria bacterium]|nr:glycoside hydrolase family 9 protein [Deltaproteobacteria bacterium]